MNNSYFSSQAGVKFYLDYLNHEVIDIDIMPSVTEVVFTGSKDFMLLCCMKQFKNIKKIIIDQSCSAKISISNFMFPNIKEVESHSARYSSGHLLIENSISLRTYTKTKTLLNTFCAAADEEIDISDISYFHPCAFKGCMSEHILIGDELANSHTQLSISLQKSMVNLSLKEDGVHIIKSTGMSKRVIINVDDGTDILHIENDMCLSPIEDVTVNTLIIDTLDYHTFGFGCSLVKIRAKTIRINDMSEFEVKRISGKPSIQYENFEIADTNIYFKTVDGILYSSDGERLICCPPCKKGHIEVQEGCKTLDMYAFRQSEIESIYIPDSVKNIYIDCFKNCINLKAVRLSNNLEKISGGTFSGCVELEYLDIPGSVTEIISHAFIMCNNLKSIKFHDGLKEIKNDVFYDCTALTTLELPSSLSYISDNNIATNINKIVLNSPLLNVVYAFVKEQQAYDEQETDIIEVSIETEYLKKTFFMPKKLTKAKRKSMNYLVNRYMQGYEDVGSQIDKLYEMCSTVAKKQKIALAAYKKSKNPEIEAYLRRSGKNIAERLILDSKKEEEKVVDFLKFGLLKESALKQLLKLANESDMPTVSAYILSLIDEFSAKNQKSFRL